MFGKNFSTDSFVYRFLAWPDSYLYRDETPKDICELRGAVLRKLFIIFFSVGLPLLYLTSIGSYIADVWNCDSISSVECKKGLSWFSHLGGFLAWITCVLAILTVGSYFTERIYKLWINVEKKVKVDTPLNSMYTSWKDRVCYPITFDDETEPSDGRLRVECDQDGYSYDATVGHS